jgi:hypothetical protein
MALHSHNGDEYEASQDSWRSRIDSMTRWKKFKRALGYSILAVLFGLGMLGWAWDFIAWLK